jgi:hypothetical protein
MEGAAESAPAHSTQLDWIAHAKAARRTQAERHNKKRDLRHLVAACLSAWPLQEAELVMEVNQEV